MMSIRLLLISAMIGLATVFVLAALYGDICVLVGVMC